MQSPQRRGSSTTLRPQGSPLLMHRLYPGGQLEHSPASHTTSGLRGSPQARHLAGSSDVAQGSGSCVHAPTPPHRSARSSAAQGIPKRMAVGCALRGMTSPKQPRLAARVDRKRRRPVRPGLPPVRFDVGSVCTCAGGVRSRAESDTPGVHFSGTDGAPPGARRGSKRPVFHSLRPRPRASPSKRPPEPIERNFGPSVRTGRPKMSPPEPSKPPPGAAAPPPSCFERTPSCCFSSEGLMVPSGAVVDLPRVRRKTG